MSLRKIFFLIFMIILFGCKKEEYKFSTINPKCGPESLQYILGLYGIQSNINELCALADYNDKAGTNMYGLYQAAKTKGLLPDAIKCDLEKLCSNKYPSIVFVDGSHFIVFIGCMNDSISIFDPPDNPKIISKNEFKKRWKGETLIFNPPNKKNTISENKPSNKKIQGPRIEFENKEIYVGSVETGSKVKHDFIFKNTGTDTLKIIALRTRCNCLDPLPDDRIIPPGGNGKISLEYNSKGKSRGKDEQTAIVMTNDPLNKVVHLTIQAVILTEVKVVPDKIDIGEVVCGQTIEKIIQVKDSGIGEIKINSIETPDCIIAKVQKEIVDSKGALTIPVKLGISAYEKPCKFEEFVTVKTNNKNTPEFKIPIVGEIVSNYQVYPPQIIFSINSENLAFVKEITVSTRNNEEIKDIEVKSNQFLSIKIEKIDKTSFKIIVKVVKPVSGKTINEKIDILAGDNSVISIPVYGKITD